MRYLVTLLLIGTLTLAAVAGPNEALAAAVADARTLAPDLVREARYLYVGNLPAKEREEALQVLSYRVNSLSTEPELAAPKVITAEVLRVALADYGWKRETWEKLAAIEPYFHKTLEVEEEWGYQRNGRWTKTETRKVKQTASYGLNPETVAQLITLTHSQAPFVRADWWFVQVSRQVSLGNKQTGAGYYDWFGIKNRGDFEKLIGLDIDASIKLGKEMRAAVEFSGVSEQNRQIERYQTLTGGTYRTLDTDDSTGAGDAIANLQRGTFKHLAEEHYGVLPNGLYVYLLCDTGGGLQSSAPDFIGPDDSPLRRGRDGRIHVGIACERCHTQGLRDIDDWVRRQAKAIKSTDYQEFLRFKRQYLSPLARQLDKDRLVYAEALKQANGLAPAENARAVAAFYHRYVDEPVNLERAAEELCTCTVDLLQHLARLKAARGYLDPRLEGLLAKPPVPMRRDHWEQVYTDEALYLGGK